MRILLTIIFISIFLFTGCKSTSVNENKTEVLKSWNNETHTYEWDQWDYYVAALKSGKVVFEWPTAIFLYLISNVKFFYDKPRGDDYEWYEGLGVVVIIFRWDF